jgi:hypothetical protein
MDRRLSNEIERLLAELDDRPNSADARLLARARLAADFAEGLSGKSVDEDTKPDQLARLATFLDGDLSQSDRDTLMVALARDATRRADLASAVALLDAAETAPQPAVPADLMSRAVTEFAPEKLSSAVSAQPQRGWWYRRRIMWASAAAALLIAVAVPAAWRLINERLDSQPTRDDGSLTLPTRSVAPETVPQLTNQPAPLEQSVRPERPAAMENSTERAHASAPLQRRCDDVVPSAAVQPPRNDKAAANRGAGAASPELRSRDPCPPRQPSEAANPPKASTAR